MVESGWWLVACGIGGWIWARVMRVCNVFVDRKLDRLLAEKKGDAVPARPESPPPAPTVEYGSGLYKGIFWRWRWGTSPVGHKIPLDLTPFCMMCGREMDRAERSGHPRWLYLCPCLLSEDAPGGFDQFEAEVGRDISRDRESGVVPDRPPFETS